MAVTRPGTNSARTRKRPVAAAPSRRHGGDIIRLVAAFVLFAVTALLVRANAVPQLEIDAFRVANDLPSWLGPGFLVIMQLGNVLAAPALARRRVRLAVDLAAGGLAAWLIAKVVKGIAQRPRPGAVLPNVIFRGAPDAGYGFVSGHAAVSVALATAASPYLGRRWRRLVMGARRRRVPVPGVRRGAFPTRRRRGRSPGVGDRRRLASGGGCTGRPPSRRICGPAAGPLGHRGHRRSAGGGQRPRIRSLPGPGR